MTHLPADLSLTDASCSRRTLLGYGLAGPALAAFAPLDVRAAPARGHTWLLAAPNALRPPRPADPTPAELDELMRMQALRSSVTNAAIARWSQGAGVLPWTAVALDLVVRSRRNPVRAGRALAHSGHVTGSVNDPSVDSFGERAPVGFTAPVGVPVAADAARERALLVGDFAGVAAAAPDLVAAVFGVPVVGAAGFDAPAFGAPAFCAAVLGAAVFSAVAATPCAVAAFAARAVFGAAVVTLVATGFLGVGSVPRGASGLASTTVPGRSGDERTRDQVRSTTVR